jgi:hypothetical protein
MVGRVDARARALVADHARLRQWLPEAAADPLVGAAHRSSAALRWSLASAGLRELPQYFQEVAALRMAAPQLDMALNAARPAVQRLAATMWLSGALGVPWVALGSGPDVPIAAELGGQTYLLDGLEQAVPRLLLQREHRVEGPGGFMTVALHGELWAQAGVPVDPHMGNPAVLGVRAVMRVLPHVWSEVKDNWWVYGLMPPLATVGGVVVGARGGLPASWLAARPGSAGHDRHGGGDRTGRDRRRHQGRHQGRHGRGAGPSAVLPRRRASTTTWPASNRTPCRWSTVQAGMALRSAFTRVGSVVSGVTPEEVTRQLGAQAERWRQSSAGIRQACRPPNRRSRGMARLDGRGLRARIDWRSAASFERPTPRGSKAATAAGTLTEMPQPEPDNQTIMRWGKA